MRVHQNAEHPYRGERTPTQEMEEETRSRLSVAHQVEERRPASAGRRCLDFCVGRRGMRAERRSRRGGNVVEDACLGPRLTRRKPKR